MLSKRNLVITAVILTVIAAGLAIWVLGPNSQPAAPTTPSPSPAPIQTTNSGPCKDFETLTYLAYPITCKKAVGLALEQAPGTIQKVSIGNVRTSIPTSSGGIERRTVDMWLVDIKLSEPYFDDKFNKQISTLQVGIRTEEHNVLYKKPLE